VEIFFPVSTTFQSWWPLGLRRRSAAVLFLELRVRISPGTWTYAYCERCVFSGRGRCDWLSRSAARESKTTM